MHIQRGFVSIKVLIVILIGLVPLGGGVYYVMQQQASRQTASETLPESSTHIAIEADEDNKLSSSTSSVELLSIRYPLLTYRINTIEHRDARLRIIDVPSGLGMWDETNIAIGTHKIDLTGLVPYEGLKISLPAGTYRLRLEVFINGIGKTLAESNTFTVPGAMVAIPTCTIGMTPDASNLRVGENAVTFTWASKNADEAYMAHSPGMGGSPIVRGLKEGKHVLLNGSETVTVVADPYPDGYWVVVTNTRGATVCYPDGTTYFNSHEEIVNPPQEG